MFDSACAMLPHLSSVFLSHWSSYRGIRRQSAAMRGHIAVLLFHAQVFPFRSVFVSTFFLLLLFFFLVCSACECSVLSTFLRQCFCHTGEGRASAVSESGAALCFCLKLSDRHSIAVLSVPTPVILQPSAPQPPTVPGPVSQPS